MMLRPAAGTMLVVGGGGLGVVVVIYRHHPSPLPLYNTHPPTLLGGRG